MAFEASNGSLFISNDFEPCVRSSRPILQLTILKYKKDRVIALSV